MYSARIGVASGNLPTLDEPFELPVGSRLSENLLTVAWVHRRVAIPLENDGRYHDTRRSGHSAPAGGLAEPHSSENRRHIMGGTACEPGMHSHGSIEIGIRGAHNRRRRTTG